MAGSCPCGDLRCVCVRPCLCCSCTCWCDECRRLRKGQQQFCDLCKDATINKASMCGTTCRVNHNESLVKPQCAHDGLFVSSISRRFREEASGHSSSNAEAVLPKALPKKDETDEDSDEPMLEINDRCNSSESSTNKSAEGSATNMPRYPKVNVFQSCSQPRRNENRRMIDLSGCVLFDANGNVINAEEYRNLRMSQRSSNINLSESAASQESEKTVKHASGCSQHDEIESKNEDSKITKTTSVKESKSLKMRLKESSSEDSKLADDKFFGISQSSASPLSVSAPSAFNIPEPRQESESRQGISKAESSSPASASRRLSMLRVSNAHSAEKRPPLEPKSSVELIPEAPASGKSSDSSDSDSSLNNCINDLNNRLTTYAQEAARKPESPEKSDNPKGPNSPSKPTAMELSSDESVDEPSTSSNTDKMTRKC